MTPQPQGTFNAWARDLQDQQVVKANGTAFIDIGGNPMVKVGEVWEVQLVTGTTGKYSQSSMTLLKNGVLTVGTYPMQYLRFTGNTLGASASAVGPPYVYLQHGETLRVMLQGGVAADQFTVWYLYREGVPY